MRWNEIFKMKGPERHLSTRKIKVFLWLPTTIKGKTRWLEWAKIKQTYWSCDWHNDKFLN